MNFGPKNVKLWQVNFDTGEITSYMTSAAEAEFDIENGDIFKTQKAAQKKVDKMLKDGSLKNTLVDTTDWDEDEEVPYEGDHNSWEDEGVEDGIPGSELFKGDLRKKLRVETAKNIAKYIKTNGSLDEILRFLKLKKDEVMSVNVFIEWLADDDSEAPSLTAKELCRLYKEEFITSVSKR